MPVSCQSYQSRTSLTLVSCQYHASLMTDSCHSCQSRTSLVLVSCQYRASLMPASCQYHAGLVPVSCQSRVSVGIVPVSGPVSCQSRAILGASILSVSCQSCAGLVPVDHLHLVLLFIACLFQHKLLWPQTSSTNQLFRTVITNRSSRLYLT